MINVLTWTTRNPRKNNSQSAQTSYSTRTEHIIQTEDLSHKQHITQPVVSDSLQFNLLGQLEKWWAINRCLLQWYSGLKPTVNKHAVSFSELFKGIPPRDSRQSMPTYQNLEIAQLQWRQLFSDQRLQIPFQNESRQTVLTTANSRTNFPWGDQLGPKDPTLTRLYSINVSGISIDWRGGLFDDVCWSIKEMHIDIFGAQEHNLDTTQFKIRRVLFETAIEHWERNKLVIGNSPIPFESAYKPGGTMTITVDSLMGRVVKQHRDHWGRWVIQEFTGRGSWCIALFSVYQPIKKTAQPGRITVTAQQRSLLCLTQDPTTNPRMAFCRDLLRALTQYSHSSWRIQWSIRE